MNLENVMTLNDVARIMGLSKQAIYVSIRTKRLVSKKFGGQWVVTPEALERYKKTRYSRSVSRRADGDLIFDPEKHQYSIQMVAKMFGVDAQRVYYLVSRKKLKCVRHRKAYVIEIPDLAEAKKIVLG